MNVVSYKNYNQLILVVSNLRVFFELVEKKILFLLSNVKKSFGR